MEETVQRDGNPPDTKDFGRGVSPTKLVECAGERGGWEFLMGPKQPRTKEKCVTSVQTSSPTGKKSLK